MDTKIDERIALCGFYCGDCVKYRSDTALLAGELSKQIDAADFARYLHVKSKCTDSHIEKACTLPDFQIFRSVLDFISTQHCSTPCRAGGDGCSVNGPVKDCVVEKELQGCWECPENKTCDKAAFVTPIWGDTLKKNISLIQKHGIDKWLEFRPGGYIWMEESAGLNRRVVAANKK